MSDFEQMRAGLVSRGLVAFDGDCFRLTDAGHLHVDEMMSDLREAEAGCDPCLARVFWRHNFRQRERSCAD
ncbi:hypothetical protein [Pelagerythrobacter marinus]|uniref:hypothetical protein n=1 Tax=Pelagerythrobacter marinus TaxID=538382 RepID=UPI002AC8E66B|nr:hypothetical protein [Pelagerythrobacter marinus]WPZ06604.1 hypothetical protein T8T98_14500 [Pelagerythrobacter marinus]